MKTRFLSGLLLLLFGPLLFLKASGPGDFRINALIGDQSYYALTGELPGPGVNGTFRIRIHLSFVEEQLRTADISHLNESQKATRMALLDHLHNYWTAGEFPRNFDYPEQSRPCFIDQDGNICAVGYLIEQSAGRELAEAINAQFQYEYVMDMGGEALQSWIEASGFSQEELAMIQPSYQPVNYVPKGYGGASAGLAGISIGASALSLSNPNGPKWLPCMGIASGLASLTWGAVDLATYQDPLGGWGYEDNKSRKNLNFFNIGLGTASTLINSYLLFRKDKPRPKSGIGALYQPLPGGSTAYGLSFARTF